MEEVKQSTTGEIPPNHRFSQISALVTLLEAQLTCKDCTQGTNPQRFVQQRVFRIEAAIVFVGIKKKSPTESTSPRFCIMYNICVSEIELPKAKLRDCAQNLFSR